MTAEGAFEIVSHSSLYSETDIHKACSVLEEAYDMGYRLVLCKDLEEENG